MATAGGSRKRKPKAKVEQPPKPLLNITPELVANSMERLHSKLTDHKKQRYTEDKIMFWLCVLLAFVSGMAVDSILSSILINKIIQLIQHLF